MERRALVTGASGGIGYAFTQALAREGYAVTAVARSEDKLQKLMQELPGRGHRYEVADLTDAAALARLATHVATTHYDLLINNAGAGYYEWFAKTPLETHKRLVRLNCEAVFVLSHAYLQVAERGDALVNVGSVLSMLPYPSGSLYAATKAFVFSLTQSLWYEQKERGVYVMALCPGVTESGFHVAAGGKPDEVPSAHLTQTADEVVAEALCALKKRRNPVVVSCWKNRLGLFVVRFLSYKKIVNLMGGWQ